MTCTYPLSRILELSKQADEDTRRKELLDCINVPKELIAELQATSDLEVNSDITTEAASLNAFHLTKLILLIANEAFEKFGISAFCAGGNGVCKIFETRDIEVEHPISIDGKGIKKFGLAAKHSLFEELWVLEFEFMDSSNTHDMKLYGPLHRIFDSDVTLGLKDTIEQIATAGHDCSSTAGRYKVLRECVAWYLG
ncbi:hypothetical protein GE061_016761 [Apolygus lucorum]|uniref:Uncharacterized protein n=1 Tax=Apolygus lucorum TaxID=248454 RepID=A0A8S9XH72_APOLU|nr:hypothetical protein GE061_016761 [Apolygus lucorum]